MERGLEDEGEDEGEQKTETNPKKRTRIISHIEVPIAHGSTNNVKMPIVHI
jgi:hypothetical protein